jgi:hypothetical protein
MMSLTEVLALVLTQSAAIVDHAVGLYRKERLAIRRHQHLLLPLLIISRTCLHVLDTRNRRPVGAPVARRAQEPLTWHV